MTIYCPSCGKPNTDEASNCISCGTELAKKKAARFKGTMMMSGPGALPGAPGAAPPPAGGATPSAPPPVAPGASQPPPAKKDLAFQKTMLGPMTAPPGAAPGGPAPSAPGFGAPPAQNPSGGGGFGAPPPASGGGGFGAPPPASGGGGFGAPPPASGGGGFGAPPPASGGGGFGAPPAQAPSGGGGFGAPPAQAPSGGGGFGAPAPVSGFGATMPESGGGGGGFGAPPAAAAAGGFGAPSSAPPTGGGFGEAPSGPPPSGGGDGGFGGAPAAPAGDKPKSKMPLILGGCCLLIVLFGCLIGGYYAWKIKNAAEEFGGDLAGAAGRLIFSTHLGSIHQTCTADPSGASASGSFNPAVFANYQAVACQIPADAAAIASDGARSQVATGDDGRAAALGLPASDCFTLTAGQSKFVACGGLLIHMENPGQMQ